MRGSKWIGDGRDRARRTFDHYQTLWPRRRYSVSLFRPEKRSLLFGDEPACIDSGIQVGRDYEGTTLSDAGRHSHGAAAMRACRS
jgi:hypothetical protein